MGIHVYLIQQMNFSSKENSRKKSFPCKMKAPMSCIPMEGTHLWWPITKLMEIVTSIYVCLIQQMNFDSKDNGGEKSFCCKTKASK